MPQCRIVLVEAASPTYANLATAENTAVKFAPIAISNSYGGGESGTTGYEPYYNHPGIAITVSSGDSGYAAGPEFPATSPHVTAVGGTSLYQTSSTRGWTERVWSGAGCGCSTVYAKPAWQHDPLCTKRMVADVSAIADPNTGVAVYGPSSRLRSAWMVFGGTSVASPVVASIYALNGTPSSYASNTYVYTNSATVAPYWPYAASPSLNVVATGNNGSCGGTYFCTADPIDNYSGPAGLGTPSGAGAF